MTLAGCIETDPLCKDYELHTDSLNGRQERKINSEEGTAIFKLLSVSEDEVARMYIEDESTGEYQVHEFEDGQYDLEDITDGRIDYLPDLVVSDVRTEEYALTLEDDGIMDFHFDHSGPC